MFHWLVLGFGKIFRFSKTIASFEKLSALLQKYQAFHFKDIKLKIGTDLADSMAKINLIREVFGAAINIRLDVNTSWTMEEARRQIPVFLNLGVNTFEQIFPIENYGGPEFEDDQRLSRRESLLLQTLTR